MSHPREHRASSFSRRRFLQLLAAGVPATAAFLAACGRRSALPSPVPAIPLARQNHPVRLPLFDELPPIGDGLPPEADAELRIYGWGPSYIAPRLVKDFEDRYECRIKYIVFREMDQAVAQLRTGTFQADLFMPTVKVLGALAASRTLQPLNYSYIPNLRANVWQSLQSPFYDVGPRYTVPYFVWTTGIAWRNDLVKTDIREMANPYDIFWDPDLRGHVHVLNSVQDLIGMTLLRNGERDPNSEDPAKIAEAKESLLDMVDAVAPSIDSTDYHDLFTGSAHVHQSWSGNLSYARHYAPEPQDIKKLSYWWPPEGHDGKLGLIGNDTLAILASAQNPVLAHHFINFTLDGGLAYENSVYNGYQSPVDQVTSERLVANDDVPANLRNIIVTKENFALGTEELELSPHADVLWHEAYNEVEAAAKRASTA